MNLPSISRRHFVKAAAAATAFSVLPSRGQAPAGGKVNLALIGVGGQGGSIGKTFHTTGLANIVALCDVDMGGKGTEELMKKFPDVPRFKDFRQMFDKMADKIDAVTVGVPDHSHFPIAMQAMALGKHVFVEKPLAHTFQEVDLMIAAEKKHKVVAQMGNQGHSGGNYFQFKAWTEAGVIKDVTRIDAFMNSKRRWHGWNIEKMPSGQPMPSTLDWETWLGTAPFTDFDEKLHPGNWRSFFNYGNGAFGDWGPHILDTAHRFLELGLPTEIEAVKRVGPNPFIFPQASTIRFHFPKRGDKPEIDVFWYDGVDNKPPRPKEYGDREIKANGKFIYSKDLVFAGGTHSDTLRIIPEDKMKEMAPTLPRPAGKNSDHYRNFLLACKGEEEARSPFHISGPLSQVFLLGVIAQRLGGTLKFDPATRQITNNPEANALLAGPPPRKGWESFYKL